MGETRILPTHDKRNPLVLIPDPREVIKSIDALGSGISKHKLCESLTATVVIHH